MQQYTCRNSVLAKSMTLGEYNDYRGWKIPDDGDPNKLGYLVEYLDTPTTNMPHGHDNYISWSPKITFEKIHKEFNPFSLGVKRVNLEFNPSHNSKVDTIKLLGAELIDEINSLIEPGERSDKSRDVNIAITDIQKGVMFGVKANFNKE